MCIMVIKWSWEGLNIIKDDNVSFRCFVNNNKLLLSICNDFDKVLY